MKIKSIGLTMLVMASMILAACAAKPSSSTSGSSTIVDVKISNFAFDPATLTIKVGTEVRWTNNDNVQHDVTSVGGNELNSGSIDKGQVFTHVFNTAGTFAYMCKIHPNMTATIIVTP